MTNSNCSRRKCSLPRSPSRLLKPALWSYLARNSPAAFVQLCLRDADGGRVTQAPVHHALHQFLSDHPKALVELPRDHGKTFQVCGRIVWELGNNPGLRVKVV